MDFEWDESKRGSNLAKHAIDFLRATQIFDGRPIYTRPSTRGSEARFVSVGEIDGELIAVVWTERPEAIRMISARRARNVEKRAYRSLFR